MTIEQLQAENAAQREMIAALGSEIDALYGIFAAVGDAAAKGTHSAYLVGYVGGIDGVFERGNVRLLRAHAEAIRSHAEEVAEAADDEYRLTAKGIAAADAAPAWCPAVTVLDDETLYCDRDAGHPGSHHAPGPDEGSEVAWSDELHAEAGVCPCGTEVPRSEWREGHRTCGSTDCAATAAQAGAAA